MDATVHLILRTIYRDSFHATLQNRGALGQNGHQIAATQEVEDDIDIVYLYHNLEVEVLAIHQVLKGIASLQALAWQDEIITLQVG